MVTVQSRWANRFLETAHEKFAARGLFLSRFDLNFRNDSSSVRLLLAPTADPYDVLLLAGTRGESDGPGTAEIAEWLRGFARERPFELRKDFRGNVAALETWVRRSRAFICRWQ